MKKHGCAPLFLFVIFLCAMGTYITDFDLYTIPIPTKTINTTNSSVYPTPIAFPTSIPLVPEVPANHKLLGSLYDKYILTQGPHGFSYGHDAIDISGGAGATLKSPINGVVLDNYVDEWGNTTLILDNLQYIVTLLHGNFSVKVGDRVSIGDVIGTEGNNGYVADPQGRLCGTNTACGYHSHLNIFDKELQININPLDHFSIQPSTNLN